MDSGEPRPRPPERSPVRPTGGNPHRRVKAPSLRAAVLGRSYRRRPAPPGRNGARLGLPCHAAATHARAAAAYEQLEKVRRADHGGHQTRTELSRGDHRAAQHVRGAHERGAEKDRDGNHPGVLTAHQGPGRVRCHEAHETDRSGEGDGRRGEQRREHDDRDPGGGGPDGQSLLAFHHVSHWRCSSNEDSAVAQRRHGPPVDLSCGFRTWTLVRLASVLCPARRTEGLPIPCGKHAGPARRRAREAWGSGKKEAPGGRPGALWW